MLTDATRHTRAANLLKVSACGGFSVCMFLCWRGLFFRTSTNYIALSKQLFLHKAYIYESAEGAVTVTENK